MGEENPCRSSRVIGRRAPAGSTGVDPAVDFRLTTRSRHPTYRERVPPAYRRLFDLALAAGVTAVGLAELWLPFTSRQGDGSAVATSAVVVLAGLALTQRRTSPLLAGLVVLWSWPLLFSVVEVYVLFYGQFVPMAIAVFSMARFGRGRVPYLGAAAGATTLLSFDLFVESLQSPGEIVFHWSVFTMVWLFGWGLSRFEHRAHESTRRAVEAEVAAAEHAMAAVLEERTRIARELHDIVAHSVSIMVVQAGAAEQVVDDDPDYARQALATIRTTGASALAEMRRVVTMLRDSDEPGALAPQPGLSAVTSLVEEARATGLRAELDVVGDAPPAPAGRRPGGVPDRAGGAEQRQAARRRLRGERRPDLWGRRRGDRGRRRRARPERRARGQRVGRHA